MAICRECGKDWALDYQEIQTKRKTKVIICNQCLREMQEEAKRARDSQKPIREHK